jgi:hypothetical protein
MPVHHLLEEILNLTSFSLGKILLVRGCVA